MAKLVPMHGRDHRAPGYYGPDDPGGADPVPFRVASVSGDNLFGQMLALAPAGFWKLDESSGTVAHDSSGNGYDLSVPASYTAPTWGDTSGLAGGGQCALFTATSFNRLYLSSFPNIPLGGTHDFSVIGWMRFTSNNAVALGSNDPSRSGGSGWQIWVSPTTYPPGRHLLFSVSISGADFDILASDAALTIDDWYMLATVRRSGTQYLYVNGVLQAATSTSTWSSSGGIWIGNDGFLSGGSPTHDTAMDGDLAYWAIYDKALADSDIADAYAKGTSGNLAAAKKVLTSAGDGSSDWEYPWVSSYLNGA